jgi:G3E family GTPase
VPITWEALAEAFRALGAAMGEKILRLKGVLFTPGQPEPLAVQAIGSFLHGPEAVPSWPDRRSCLVFIVDGADSAAIRPYFPWFYEEGA